MMSSGIRGVHLHSNTHKLPIQWYTTHPGIYQHENAALRTDHADVAEAEGTGAGQRRTCFRWCGTHREGTGEQSVSECHHYVSK